MRLGELKSVGHNLADSLASGLGLMIGVYSMNIFSEAMAEEGGYIVVDFLTGETSGRKVSSGLKRGSGSIAISCQPCVRSMESNRRR